MKAYWVIGIAIAAGLPAQPKNCSLDVFVEPGVPMPVGMLLNAKVKATQMFREIGVTVRMRNGIPAHELSDACRTPILVQIENGWRYRGGSNTLAYATPFKKSGICIHVFVDRVQRILNHEPFFANALLAHVMLHEITHVLQQMDRHSAEGVMKAVWSGQDYETMNRNPLPMAPEDVEFIRTGLAVRIGHVRAK